MTQMTVFKRVEIGHLSKELAGMYNQVDFSAHL